MRKLNRNDNLRKTPLNPNLIKWNMSNSYLNSLKSTVHMIKIWHAQHNNRQPDKDLLWIFVFQYLDFWVWSCRLTGGASGASVKIKTKQENIYSRKFRTTWPSQRSSSEKSSLKAHVWSPRINPPSLHRSPGLKYFSLINNILLNVWLKRLRY